MTKKAIFKGIMNKEEFYLLLEYIDSMKKGGWSMERHERKDFDDNTVNFNYELIK